MLLRDGSGLAPIGWVLPIGKQNCEVAFNQGWQLACVECFVQHLKGPVAPHSGYWIRSRRASFAMSSPPPVLLCVPQRLIRTKSSSIMKGCHGVHLHLQLRRWFMSRNAACFIAPFGLLKMLSKCRSSACCQSWPSVIGRSSRLSCCSASCVLNMLASPWCSPSILGLRYILSIPAGVGIALFSRLFCGVPPGVAAWACYRRALRVLFWLKGLASPRPSLLIALQTAAIWWYLYPGACLAASSR